MIRSRICPICGGDLMFSYVRPDFDFYIKDDKIEIDENRHLWEGNPHLEFYCSFDKEHDITKPSLVDATIFEQTKWEEKITEEFYEKIFPDL